MQSSIRYSCIYLNRGCVRNCSYCYERNAPLRGKELTEPEWERVITHLDSLGIKFHLFLGNDFLLSDRPLKLVKFLKGRTDYAFYSTMEPKLFNKYKDRLLPAGLYNLSAGIDVLSGDGDIAAKSIDGLAALSWLKQQGIPDCQGTITLGKHNLSQSEAVVKTLSDRGIFVGLNVVHWNKDGGFDFFPPREVIKDYMLQDTKELRDLIKNLIVGLKSSEYLFQNPPEYLEAILTHGINLSWHCSQPLVVSVDADSSLRVCGYRPGKWLPRYSVFDLGDRLPLDKYAELWYEESSHCSGCCWSYYWQAQFTEQTNEYHKEQMFTIHYSPYIKEVLI